MRFHDTHVSLCLSWCCKGKFGTQKNTSGYVWMHSDGVFITSAIFYKFILTFDNAVGAILDALYRERLKGEKEANEH